MADPEFERGAAAEPGAGTGPGASAAASAQPGPVAPEVSEPVTPEDPDPPPPTGPELARAVLEAAQARRRTGRPRRGSGKAGDTDGAGGAGSGRSGGRRRSRSWSGPGPDPRDPQPFAAVLAKLVKARGWQRPTAEATIFGQWEKVVGAELAEHCRPVKLERGELTVEAESTAWATQLRLLAGSLLKQIAAEIGHNIVKKLHIHGPAAPSWNRGPRRVRGRGPRDTYG